MCVFIDACMLFRNFTYFSFRVAQRTKLGGAVLPCAGEAHAHTPLEETKTHTHTRCATTKTQTSWRKYLVVVLPPASHTIIHMVGGGDHGLLRSSPLNNVDTYNRSEEEGKSGRTRAPKVDSISRSLGMSLLVTTATLMPCRWNRPQRPTRCT